MEFEMFTEYIDEGNIMQHLQKLLDNTEMKRFLEIKDRNFQKHDTRAEAIRIQLISKEQRKPGTN